MSEEIYQCNKCHSNHRRVIHRCQAECPKCGSFESHCVDSEVLRLQAKVELLQEEVNRLRLEAQLNPISQGPRNEDGLSREEQDVIIHLARAWNAFISLPKQHPDDVTEFRHDFHKLQYLIMVRPLRDQYPVVWTNDAAGATKR